MTDSILSAPYFHNEEAAYEFVEKRIWPHGPVCPHCGVIGGHYRLKGKSTRVGSPQVQGLPQALPRHCRHHL